LSGSGEALASGLLGEGFTEIGIEEPVQGLDHEGVASETGAPGGPVQLLAEVRLQADAGGGRRHAILCVTVLGLSRGRPQSGGGGRRREGFRGQGVKGFRG